jgi:TetR/AcrR family transcriptional repressor of nem operon
MGRPKAFDEDTVLDAATELFWSQGYDATSMADLEAGMGMGRQSIYNAFGDKRALFLRALERYIRNNGENVDATLRAPGRGLDAIRRHFEALVDFAAPQGPRRGCLVANSILEVGESDEAIAGRCQANQELVLDGFRHALRTAIADGDLSESVDVDAMARMLLAQTYGMSVLSKAGASRRELRDSVEELLARLGA